MDELQWKPTKNPLIEQAIISQDEEGITRMFRKKTKTGYRTWKSHWKRPVKPKPEEFEQSRLTDMIKEKLTRSDTEDIKEIRNILRLIVHRLELMEV